MRTYSGVILDQYDDPRALVVQATFGTGGVPSMWKHASVRPPETIRPDDWALCLVVQGAPMYKYAMTDPQTTQLSALYFMSCGAKLPLRAQKVAAINLAAAMEEQGLPIPPQILEKVDV